MCTDVEKGGNVVTSLGIIVGYTILEGCSILGSQVNIGVLVL
jgi:hypothetical protein